MSKSDKTPSSPGKVPGLPGPTLLERALFPLRLVFSAKSKALPYNCLNRRVVAELLSLRRNWTFLTSNKQGRLKDEEWRVMMDVYGKAWFKEYYLPFVLSILCIFGLVLVSTIAYGLPGCVLGAVGGYALYAAWVGATMNVIRPGELKRLLPYLRLDGADRAYLEAIDALTVSDHSHEFKIKILAILNNLLERDFALQTEQNSDELNAPEAGPDLSSLEGLASDHAGSPLGDVYAETLRLAKQRSQSLEIQQTRAQLLSASRALILEKLYFVKSSIQSRQATEGKSDSSRAGELLEGLLGGSLQDEDFIHALEEVNGLPTSP